MSGAVVSTTDTRNVPDASLPWLSVAEHVTVVVPSANVEPDDGVHEGVIDPSTMSFAVALKVATAPAALVASRVMSSGAVTTGAVVSVMLTVNSPVDSFPA